jgi:hypothetical protein
LLSKMCRGLGAQVQVAGARIGIGKKMSNGV